MDFNSISTICLKSYKCKVAIVLISLVFLFSCYYDELNKPSMNSILKSEQAKNAKILKTSNATDEIAWILSFPNSGTSFTTALVRELTHTSTATNYLKSKHPPFVFPEIDFSPIILRKNLPLPNKGYILTKTHCTRCDGEKQKSIIKTTDEFMRGCQSMKIDGQCHQYPTDIVKRAVHLIRNPYDNIVGRFHLEYKTNAKRGDTEWIEKYPYSKEGFRQWCYEYPHHQSYKPDKIFLKTLMDTGIVCPIEFYLYVQFHNNALNMTNTLDIPVHVMDYTTYYTDFQGTADNLLTFLGQEQVPGTKKEFYYSSHEDYYTEVERRDIAKFLLEYASPETRNHLYRMYLEKLA